MKSKKAATGSSDQLSLLDELGDKAEQALRARPSFSIRKRLSLGFAVWFVLSIGIAIFSVVNVSQIRSKLHFLEAAQNYTFEIQQARRFEKNFFLYHTNIDDALEHLSSAMRILEKEETKIKSVVGEKDFDTMKRHLVQYRDLLIELRELGVEHGGTDSRYGEIEVAIREHGAETLLMARQFMAKESEAVNTLLDMSQRTPVIFLVILLLLMIYLAIFVAYQMLAPLKRMMDVTRRIAGGDFTPITPIRRYHDEFSEMAIAMNYMMKQLVHRHEQLAQYHKLKAVGTLTAGVAHELNNPINNIILTSSALMEEYRELDESELEDMINDLTAESERAQKIVRNLLDFARESEIETESLEVEEVIDETLQLASNQVKLAGVKVTGELAGNLPHVYGDRQQLTQVFLNIVMNALDAMPDGGTLTIRADCTQDRDYVGVEFTDTGVGIPAHKLNQIFDPFYTSKKKDKGTGLGLSVSLGIIQKHGGDIRVSSREGQGTVFTVLLPAVKMPAASADNQDEEDSQEIR